MLVIELIGYADGIVKVHHLAQRSSRIVGMAGIVNLTALDHEEEALLMLAVVEMIDSSRGDLCQCEVALARINGIGERVLHHVLLLYQHHLVLPL